MGFIRAVLIIFFLAGCSGMSKDWGVGFMQGVRDVPQHDFTPQEKEAALAAKARFEKPFQEELTKKLAENDLSGLKGWLVVFDFFSDGNLKTANVWVYTYWGQEQRYKVFSIPLKSFLDEARLPVIAEEAAQEAASLLLQKAAVQQKQTVD